MIFKVPVYFEVDSKLGPSDSSLLVESVRKTFTAFLKREFRQDFIEFPFLERKFILKLVTEVAARKAVVGNPRLSPLIKPVQKTKKFSELNSEELALLKAGKKILKK